MTSARVSSAVYTAGFVLLSSIIKQIVECKGGIEHSASLPLTSCCEGTIEGRNFRARSRCLDKFFIIIVLKWDGIRDMTFSKIFITLYYLNKMYCYRNNLVLQPPFRKVCAIIDKFCNLQVSSGCIRVCCNGISKKYCFSNSLHSL